jgi:medium-chain acyl-[acyl-carrier-protein] hydrolase
LGTEAVYRNTYTIGYSDVDFLKNLKCSKLFEYFQDTAGEAADRLGAGVDTLAEKYSVTWVLTRIRVEFTRIPELNESITVATWPHPPGKLEFERDFTVADGNGDVIVRAVSTWVVIDTKTRELRRSDYIHMEYPEFNVEHALDSRPGKLRPSGDPEPVYRKVVGYSDVDFNGHINNSRYIDYIMDCFPVESHRQYMIKTLEVNYLKEAFPGDTLLLCREIPRNGGDTAGMAGGEAVCIEGVDEKEGKPCFRARIRIEPRK